jgi:regulator of sirC expression with transglutaminase-like and TPR domain
VLANQLRYSNCTEDFALRLDLQRRLQSILPCDPVITLHTNNSPSILRALYLARALEPLAEAP